MSTPQTSYLKDAPTAILDDSSLETQYTTAVVPIKVNNNA
jgi:hypothetical protein